MNFAQAIAQIKERVSLMEYIGRYVVLKRFGAYYKGLCPFHNEKTSSFVVREDFYHCFGCGEHGDIFTFLQKIKQQSFVDVIKDLAHDLGIELRENIDDSYLKLQQLLKDFITQAQANVHLAGDYLQKRGITQQSMQRYQLGFVTQALLNKFNDVDQDLKQKLGINYMLKDRLLFPIKTGGHIVGMGARILNDDLTNGPKYINSPDSILFQKRRLLYGDGFFEQTGKRKTIICEGYTDVILINQIQDEHNIYKAVAPLGTAFTQEQLFKLWQIDKQPYICFDGDGAGRAATFKAAKLCLQFLGNDTSIRIVNLPADLDPAEMMQQIGSQKFHSHIHQAQELSEYIIEQTLSKAITPEKIFAAKYELRQLLLSMHNRDARDIFAQFWKHRIEKHIFALGFQRKGKIHKLPYIIDAIAPHAKILLGLIAYKPEILLNIYDEFISLALDDEMHIVQQALLEEDSNILIGKYKNYVSDFVKRFESDEEYMELWRETYRLYLKTLYQDELTKLKQDLSKDFTQETWDRITYINNLILK